MHEEVLQKQVNVLASQVNHLNLERAQYQEQIQCRNEAIDGLNGQLKVSEDRVTDLLLEIEELHESLEISKQDHDMFSAESVVLRSELERYKIALTQANQEKLALVNMLRDSIARESVYGDASGISY